jgi:tRNA(Ile)-lysidine synthase
LLRLIRGAGVAGLAGMRPKEGLLCRPMLNVWRAELEQALCDRELAWREDSSNRDPAFLRNRVRHELLPLLASLNPGIKPVLLREAELLAGRQREIDAELLRRLGLGSRQISAVLAGQAVTIKGGRRVVPLGGPGAADREPPLGQGPADALAFAVEDQSAPAASPPFDLPLPVPGRVSVAGAGTLIATIEPAAELAAAGARTRFEEVIDAAGISGALRIRSRMPGDRFIPLGMSQHKTLQDFLVDKRVPRQARDRLPLVVQGDTIVWVVGVRIDERFKVTPATGRTIRLLFVPEGSA